MLSDEPGIIMSAHSNPAPMADKTRISLSISEELLKEFDSLAKSAGQPNRSIAVSQAMREFVSSRKWDLSKKGQVPGVILLTYDHHSHGANRALTELQHSYPDVVTATMHLHLSKHTCLEKMLQSQKGVLDLKLITSAA